MMCGTNEPELRTAIRVGTPGAPPGNGKATLLREFRREHSIREITVIDQRETLGHFRACCGQWLPLYGEGATSKARTSPCGGSYAQIAKVNAAMLDGGCWSPAPTINPQYGAQQA